MSDDIQSPENNPDGINPSLEDEAAFFNRATGDAFDGTGPDELVGVVEGLSHEFDELTAQRHKAGAIKYGPGKFLTVDTIQEACDEIADLANYARYTYIRLRLLQESIAAQVGSEADEDQRQGFISSTDFTKPKGSM